jgi:hypothetical protein
MARSSPDGRALGKPNLKSESVLVYYDPLDPNKNSLTEFCDLGMITLGPVPTMLFGIGAVVWYIRARQRKVKAIQIS